MPSAPDSGARAGGDAAVLRRLLPDGDLTAAQRLFLGTDWRQTPLGDPAGWSTTLRTAVGTCLNSRFPMLVMAGPELVMAYNDGYADMLGARHPAAMGRRGAEVWADVWPVIGPMLDDVRRDRRPTYAEDLPLVMGRSGFDEETCFTFSYSPVLDPGGAVVAVLDTAIETTRRVLATRRLALAQRLGQVAVTQRSDLVGACTDLLDVLAGARTDVPAGGLYLAGGLAAGVGRPGPLRLLAAYGAGAGRPAPGLGADGTPAPWLAAAAAGTPQEVSGIAGLLPAPGEVGGGRVERVVALPVTTPGRSEPVGALVLGVSPHLAVDAEYRTFLDLVARQVGAVVGDTLAHLAELRLAEEQVALERQHARRSAEVATVLQRAILGPAVLPPGFAVRYVPASEALEVGGDWHDVVDLDDGRVGIVVGDVVGRGLAAAAVMGQLRSAARAVLLQTGAPGVVLGALDRLAATVPGAAVATVSCAVLDPGTGRLRYSRGGHLPAVLARPDGSTALLDGAGSLPLAVATRPRPEADVVLEPGSVLLLCTDGLVERRGEPLDAGFDRAAAALAAGRHLPGEELADHLLTALVPGGRDDDVVLLLYRQG